MSGKAYERAGWIAATNIYEVNIRQYTPEGTFKAFAMHLPRLKDMGVELLWLMPIHPIGEKNRKGTLGSYYSIKDFKAVNPEFGTADDLKALIENAHGLGIKIILDWVANHAAWDNVWTTAHPGYFERDAGGNFKAPYDWTDVIQIDHSSEAEQEAMIDAMKYWVTGFDIDGFRADLAHLTPLEFWKKARTAIEPLKKDLFWLAETEEVNYHEVFDASFTWEWMHKSEDYCKERTGIHGLHEVLQRYETGFPSSAYRMYFTSNHDENSWNGTEYEKYGLMTEALAVFSFTWNGIPLIYSGQEIPNRRRLKFFDKDALAWTAANELHTFYKTLLGFRKRNPALRACDPAAGSFLVSTSNNRSVMSYLRKNEKEEVLVLLNLSGESTGFTILDKKVNGSFRELFTGIEYHLNAGSAIELGPGGFLVFERMDK